MAELSPALKYKITKAATLLAQSPIDDNIKNILNEKIGQLSETDLDNLIYSLEREASELAVIGQKIKKFDEEQDKDWKSLEKKQQEKADQMAEDFLKKLA